MTFSLSYSTDLITNKRATYLRVGIGIEQFESSWLSRLVFWQVIGTSQYVYVLTTCFGYRNRAMHMTRVWIAW